MATKIVHFERFSLVSSRPFDAIVKTIEAHVAHPYVKAFTVDMAAGANYAELEGVVNKAVAGFDFMEFARFNVGEVLRKERGPQSARILRLVIGNPLVMKQMVVHVPDAASYAPVTILIDERPDGVHLSYDQMASLLAPYESAEATAVAQKLDAKIESLLALAAG